MKVILDVNKPSSLSCGVQSCSSVEGFLELERLHPEDEFVIDPASIEAFLDYQERVAMNKVKDFCDEMGISYEDFSAMINYYGNTALVVDAYEAEEEYLAADYDYWLECSQDAMWITKNS